jgi:crotonobetainyl-CoA:carnitine CoA-transferase CaiB-like acyl-CoA transferase
LSDGVESDIPHMIVAGPLGLSKCRPVFRKAPLMGQDNVEILTRFGFTEEDVELLEKEWAGKAVQRKK